MSWLTSSIDLVFFVTVHGNIKETLRETAFHRFLDCAPNDKVVSKADDIFNVALLRRFYVACATGFAPGKPLFCHPDRAIALSVVEWVVEGSI